MRKGGGLAFALSHPFRKTQKGRGAQVLMACLLVLIGCRSSRRDPNTVVFLIEASPTNLDRRVGTDGQSEHIDELIFDGLVAKDQNFHFTPALAESWELRDPVT